MDFISSLVTLLKKNANPDEAGKMQAYMRELFSYYGVKAPIRKALLKETYATYLPDLSHSSIISIAKELYEKPQRELHYCAMEITDRFLKKKYIIDDIHFIEFLITTHSWWDTVDFIAKHILGNYLLQYPDQIPAIIKEYSESNNMWLNRSAILFQLGYKNKTDAHLLFALCDQHKSSTEFFIKKAIGWALREYSKVAPEAVVSYISTAKLQPLSEKEGLKRIP
ncbi:DNA alkylation repair protein [Aquimarina sp. 2201CG1-2-11]|uniref:DNA alkylation repair protein n=1 Tax=Aquimarina discodermiae TaxID=3231043 RepID=UPI00346362CF